MRAALVAALIAGGCAVLPDVPRDECGNGVREPDVGEECDGVDHCGEPDTANACRLVCDDLGAGCPDGWGCGADLRCRRPTETFAAASRTTMPSAGVSVRDMDADGADDLLGYDSRGLVTRFGDPDGAMADQTRLPLPFSDTGAVTPDADLDTDLDLVVPLPAGGWALFVNDGARTLVPAAQSAIALDLPGECVPLTVGAANGGPNHTAELLMSIGGQDLRFIEKDECGASPDCVLAPGGGAVLDGAFHAAELGYGAADGVYGGEQFTALVEGQDTISVWGHALDGSRPKRIDTWTLPEPVGATGHVAFLQLALGDCTDLVVDTGTSLAVVFGKKDLSGNCVGLAHQAGVAVRFDRPMGDIIGAGRLGTVDSLLYTIAYATGPSTLADVVASYTWDGVGFRSAALLVSDGHPHAAAVLDYNRDGFPDVALAVDDTSTVDLYLNYAWQGFNAFPVDVGGTARRPVVGDFDGDLFDDLVVAVSDPTNPAGLDHMYIVYGDPSGHPPPAQFVGDFVADTTTTPVRGGTNQLTSSLIVVSNKLPTGTSDACDRRLAILLGNTARQLISPYVVLHDTGTEVLGLSPLATFDVSSPGLPQVLAVGEYTDTASGTSHVIASLLGFDLTAHTFVTVGPTLEIPAASLPGASLRNARWRSGDLSGDGLVDGVALASDRLASIRVDAAGIHADVQTLPPDLGAVGWFDLVDLDGDGDLDIVGSATGLAATANASAPAGAFWALWNDGDGNFDASAPTVLAIPDTLYCFAAAAIRSNDTGAPQLLGACYGGVGGAIELALSTFDPERDPDQVSDVRVFPLDAAVSDVAVGDFTGDGLDDIALLGSGVATILRQCSDADGDVVAETGAVSSWCAGFTAL